MLGELAAEASDGQQIVVPGASHYIQLDRPDVVAHAILELLPTS
jgi:pimeloyl-ACP methyl ester carboxylesterase